MQFMGFWDWEHCWCSLERLPHQGCEACYFFHVFFFSRMSFHNISTRTVGVLTYGYKFDYMFFVSSANYPALPCSVTNSDSEFFLNLWIFFCLFFFSCWLAICQTKFVISSYLATIIVPSRCWALDLPTCHSGVQAVWRSMPFRHLTN